MHGGGVAGAIVRKGGEVIQRESNAWVSWYSCSYKTNCLAVGQETWITREWRSCRHWGWKTSLHASYPCSWPYLAWRRKVFSLYNRLLLIICRGEPEELESAVLNSLIQASKLNLPSISVPAISRFVAFN